jgi:DNA polymerase-4
VILHVDMDAYYASVEQRDNSALRGKPVVVGGSADRRGVVSAASYEAREFGIHSAMPMMTALRKCPHAIVARTRMSHYAAISKQIREIYNRFTPTIEPLALDEAFLDVEGCEGLFGPPEVIAAKVKQTIFDETQLVASVGVAPNKFLAKIASDLEKPDGLVVVDPNRILQFLEPLPISRLWGVGKASEKVLKTVGIHTIGQVRLLSPEVLTAKFGELGTRLWELAHGRDDRKVIPDREAKTISHETTFAADISDKTVLRAWLLELTEQVAERLRRNELLAKTVNLKLRFSNFETITRARSFGSAVDSTNQIWQSASELLEQCVDRPIRLIGVGVSNITRERTRQMDLFAEDSEKDRQLDSVSDSIRSKFGRDSLSRGTTGFRKPPRK